MALIKCKECKHEVSTQAKTCPHCGASVYQSIGCGGALLAIIITVVLVYFSVLPSINTSSNKSSRKKNPDNIEICVMTRSFVERSLKAPSTAKFPSCSSLKIVRLGDQAYRVSSYVDAQNSFGAMLRKYYTVEIKYKGNDNWELLNIDIR